MDPQFLLKMPLLAVHGEASIDAEDACVSGLQAGLSLRSLLGRSDFVNDARLQAQKLSCNFLTGAPLPPHSSIRGERLPNLLSLDGSEHGLPMDRRFHKSRGQESRRTRGILQQETVTDKTRRLQKLLPSDERMGTAAVLEETHKYIRFLEAQVSVLMSMPCDDRYYTEADDGGSLGKFGRQKLLQAVVNSSAVQKVCYTNGFCVCSAEQLEMISAANALRFF